MMVEAHATALNQMWMLLSNHVARGQIAVRRFELGGSLSVTKLSTSPFETSTAIFAIIFHATANSALVVSVRLLNVMAYQTRHVMCQKVRAKRSNAEEEAS